MQNYSINVFNLICTTFDEEQIVELIDDLIRKYEHNEDIKELILEWIPIITDIDRAYFLIESIETKGHAITGKINFLCTNCKKSICRFNGEHIVCLNCGKKYEIKEVQ